MLTCRTFIKVARTNPILPRSIRHVWTETAFDRIMKYQPQSSDRPFRVSIEGNIGCGKSTLIKYLSGIPTVDAYTEPLDKWRNVGGHNLLDLLYKDLKRWNFTFSHYVQLTRLKIQTRKTCNPVQIFERSLQNNRYVFVEMAHQDGYLERTEYDVLCSYYDWLKDNVDINIDLIVYLRSSPSVVYNRVRQRQRPEEDLVTLDYLGQVHEYHERWLVDNPSNAVPVLEINVDHELAKVNELYKENERYMLGQARLNEKPT